MCILLAVAAVQDLELHQMDIVGAYLEGNIEEELYMRVPEGVNAPGKVCRLKKGLYGLKQAGRNWNKVITSTLTELGFHTTSADPSVFFHPGQKILVGLYVDDLLLASRSLQSIEWTKKELGKKHQVKDLGEAGTCVGIRISRERSQRTLSIDQEKYKRQNSETLQSPGSTRCKKPSRLVGPSCQGGGGRRALGCVHLPAGCWEPHVGNGMNTSRYSLRHWQAEPAITQASQATLARNPTSLPLPSSHPVVLHQLFWQTGVVHCRLLRCRLRR